MLAAEYDVSVNRHGPGQASEAVYGVTISTSDKQQVGLQCSSAMDLSKCFYGVLMRLLRPERCHLNNHKRIFGDPKFLPR